MPLDLTPLTAEEEKKYSSKIDKVALDFQPLTAEEEAAYNDQHRSMMGKIGHGIYDFAQAGGHGIYDFAQAGGHALGQIPANALRLLGANQPANWIDKTFTGPQNAGLPGTLGNITGDILGYVGPGMPLKGAMAAAKIPGALGEMINALGQSKGAGATARGIFGSAGYGALNTPEAPAVGGILGMGLGTALGGAGAGIGKLMSLESSKKLAGDAALKLMQTLGNGRSLSENRQSLAQAISKNAEMHTSQGKKQFQDILNHESLGDGMIYPGFKGIKEGNNSISDLISGKGMAVSNNPGIFGLPDNIINEVKSHAPKTYQQFSKNPTVENAHWLQSELGSAANKIKEGRSDTGDQITKKALLDAKQSLTGDIDAAIGRGAPELKGSYQEAKDFWKKNVTPYKKGKAISEISTINPETGLSINPEPKNLSTLLGSKKSESQKIISDLNQAQKHQIVYDALKNSANDLSIGKLDSQKLLKELTKLDQKGLDPLLSPEIKGLKQVLTEHAGNSMGEKLRKYLGIGGGAALGVALGSHFLGHNIANDLIGSMSGAAVAPSLMGHMGSHQLSNIPRSIHQHYNPLSAALSAALLGPGQQKPPEEQYNPGER